jgi:leucyl-tRNA synthetase
MGLHETYTIKKTTSRVKSNFKKWEKIFANHLFDKGLVYKHIRNSYNSTEKQLDF